MPTLHSSDAFVLSRRDYGESDRIISLLTKEHGRISLMARGARKSRKRFAGALEPFTEIKVEYTLNEKAQLSSLKQAKVLRYFHQILSTSTRLKAGSTLIRWLRVLVPEAQRDPRLFEHVSETFTRITTNDFPEARVTLDLLQTLALIGVMPHIESCVVTEAVPDDHDRVLFDFERGGIVSKTHATQNRTPLSPEGRRIMRQTLGQLEASNATIFALEPNDTEVVQNEIAPLLKRFASTQLNIKALLLEET